MYEYFSYLNQPTDLIMKDLIDNQKINAFILKPSVVLQNNNEYPSEIIRRNKNLNILKYLKKNKNF